MCVVYNKNKLAISKVNKIQFVPNEACGVIVRLMVLSCDLIRRYFNVEAKRMHTFATAAAVDVVIIVVDPQCFHLCFTTFSRLGTCSQP